MGFPPAYTKFQDPANPVKLCDEISRMVHLGNLLQEDSYEIPLPKTRVGNPGPLL